MLWPRKDSYPVPLLDSYIAIYGEAAVLSALEVGNDCRRVEFKETDRNKPVFISHYEQYRLVRVPFALESDPRTLTLQQAMDYIPSPVK